MEEGQTNVNINDGANGGSTGPIIGIIVILAIIILGGLYFWGQRAGETVIINESPEPLNAENERDDTSAIEADLESTDVDSVDADLNAS
jgi:hypothetical protein